MKREDGFTLVEMMAVIAVTAVLGSMIFAATKAMLSKGREAEEIAAARAVISAYVDASAQNDGILLAGYDRTATEVRQRDGSVIHGPPAQRYPWRLFPYLDRAMEGSLYLTQNRPQVDQGNEYLVSLYPAFGINYYFVGGDIQADGTITHEADCVRRLSHVSKPSKLLVFASARATGRNDEIIRGFHILTPPNLTGGMWHGGAEYSDDSSPEAYGHLDLRHNKRAVAAFLDGHVALLGLDELTDMRIWSVEAQRRDDRNYKVVRVAFPTTPSGRPRL
jgi:prepilin-type N-terminal cleavage/methylation domain-containing protein/prepilin-type processing-associated H-X9-DG protein